MILDLVSGTKLDSSSFTGTNSTVALLAVQAPDILSAPCIISMFRLGGVRMIASGVAVAINALEGKQGTGASAPTLLTAATESGPFGREVQPVTVGVTKTTAAATGGVMSSLSSYSGLAGIYNGVAGAQRRGFNFPGAVPSLGIATGSALTNAIAPANTGTMVALTTAAIPGDYAQPGDVIEVVTYGPAVALASTIGGAIAPGNSLSSVYANAVAATHEGTLGLQLAADALGYPRIVTFETAGAAFSATGVAQGVRVFCFCM